MHVAQGFTKCLGVNIGLTQVCSQLVEMDCYNAGGKCCATNSDGTGKISAPEKASEDRCGYCFTGNPATLLEQAIVEGSIYFENNYTSA